MIEVLSGERGHAVVRVNGRLLASRFDPVAEARDWLARRMAFLDRVRTVFVLGIGAGYHVAALAERTQAKIHVIEPDPELAGAVARIHAFAPERIAIEIVEDVRALRASSAARLAVKRSFVVLDHPPSVALRPEWFAEIGTVLRARDWGSLTWQWRIRDGRDFDGVPRVERSSSQGGPLTIYDLEQTELVQNSSAREGLLFKALRELVK